MRPYLLSLAIGMLVGVAYATLRVRSPAPPVVALVGLLGILAGEQLVPLIRSAVAARHDPGTTGHAAKTVHEAKTASGASVGEHEGPAKRP